MVFLIDGFNYLNKQAGNVFRVRYFTEVIGSVWDDDRTITASGNDVYTSGIILQIDQTRGSEDQVLVEQGRLRYNDSKVYVGSSILTTSGVRVFTISISGLDRVYQEII